MPKGALLPGAALIAGAEATHRRLGGPGTWLLPLAAHHIAGMQVLVRSVVAGTTPVFVDAREADGNLDPNLLDQAVSTLLAEGADIAAVIPVDLLGRVCDYPAIEEVLAAHDGARRIPVLADAAESLGAALHGRPAGSFGHAAALSFNGNKIMTTSGGGMLLSDDAALIERARSLSTQARQPVPWYEHADIGYNYRLSNLLAALGRAQLSRLDDLIARRREIREIYAAGLADLPGVRILGREPGRGDAEDNCWLTAVVIDPDVRIMRRSRAPFSCRRRARTPAALFRCQREHYHRVLIVPLERLALYIELTWPLFHPYIIAPSMGCAKMGFRTSGSVGGITREGS